MAGFIIIRGGYSPCPLDTDHTIAKIAGAFRILCGGTTGKNVVFVRHLSTKVTKTTNKNQKKQPQWLERRTDALLWFYFVLFVFFVDLRFNQARWRTVSNRQIAVAAAAFSDSTLPGIGMVILWVARFSNAADRPAPSLPIMNATLPRRSHS